MLGKAPAGIVGSASSGTFPRSACPTSWPTCLAIVPAGKPTRLEAIVTGSHAPRCDHANVLVGAGWFFRRRVTP